MKITVVTANEQIISFDVNCHESVENLRALLESETGMPFQHQQLVYNGRELSNSDTLSTVGVGNEDLIMMVSNASSAYIRFGAPANQAGFDPNASSSNSAATQPQFNGDSDVVGQLFQACLNADPMDVESQSRIEAAIRQKGIHNNGFASSEKNAKAPGKVNKNGFASSGKNPKVTGKVTKPGRTRGSSNSMAAEVEQCLIDTLISAQEEFQLTPQDIQNKQKRSRVLQELIDREHKLWRAEEEETRRLAREARRLEAQVQHMMAEHDRLERVSAELEQKLEEELRITLELRKAMHNVNFSDESLRRKHQETEAAIEATRLRIEANLHKKPEEETSKQKDPEEDPSKDTKDDGTKFG